MVYCADSISFEIWFDENIGNTFIGSNRQGAGIIDFTQAEKHSIPVAASL